MREMEAAAAPSPAVVIPTHNNAATVAEVISGAQGYVEKVVVVDDGSTDETPAILKEVRAIDVVRHERKLGKGAALRSGFARARELGATHAITVDADGQHLTDDIPVLLAKISEEPATLWIGSRSIHGSGAQPLRSRAGRKFGAFWYRFHTGRTIDDPQCGLRAYPLEAVLQLQRQTTGFEYETELLVWASWSGIEVTSVPVHLVYHPPSRSVSHFRPVRDFLRIGRVNAKASLIRIFMPWKTVNTPGRSRREKLLNLMKRELRAHTTPQRAAASLGTGVFFGIFPIHGFQVASLMALSFPLRLNRPIAFVGVSISSPPLLPIIIAAGIAVGKLILPAGLISHGTSRGRLLQYGLEWFIGSMVLAVVAGIAAYLISLPAFRRIAAALRVRRRNRRARHAGDRQP